MVRRLVYFFYYLRETDWKKLFTFLSYSSRLTNRTKVGLFVEAIIDTFRFNISLLDFFYFRFYDKNSVEKSAYAGTGFMFEYQLAMNPKSHRVVLADKIEFLNKYNNFVNRNFVTIDALRKNPSLYQHLCNVSGKLVVKGSKGQVGEQVSVISQKEIANGQALLNYMENGEFDLAEEFVVQHRDLMKLSPSGLNTVRIITQLKDQEIIIIAARLRITINSSVDNLAAGNIAAPVDLATGVVSGEGVYSDITKSPVSVHPITGIKIKGFQIPFWTEAIEMIKKAGRQIPENKSIGWDVSISESGPQLIEGNHNWCKLLWQLPVNEGLKSELTRYL